jgi:hypothetical protein
MVIKEETKKQVRWKWEFSEPLILEDDEFRHAYWRDGNDRIDFQFIVEEPSCTAIFYAKTLLSGKYGGEKEFHDIEGNSITIMTRFEFNILMSKAKKLVREAIDGGG